MQWGCQCCGNGDVRDAGLGGVPFGVSTGLGECQRSLLRLLFRCSCLLNICVQRNRVVLRFAMGLLVLWKRRWAGCWAGGRAFWRIAWPLQTPTFASMSSFSLFLFVNHLCAKKWGVTAVCNGAAGVVETAMGGMPGWAARLLARCPALANANVRFYVIFFVVLVC